MLFGRGRCGRKSIQKPAHGSVFLGINDFVFRSIYDVVRDSHAFFVFLFAVIPTDELIRLDAVALLFGSSGCDNRLAFENLLLRYLIAVCNEFNGIIPAEKRSESFIRRGAALAEPVRYTVDNQFTRRKHRIHLRVESSVLGFYPLVIAVCNPDSVRVGRFANARIHPCILARLVEIAVSHAAVAVEIERIVGHKRLGRGLYEHRPRRRMSHHVQVGCFVAGEEVINRAVYLPPSLGHNAVFIISRPGVVPPRIAA